MIWTVLTLVCMVVLGGFISYYGDLQGRRWGKKRVSWFGLRPKHTAILITSLTGAFIALLSVVTLLIAAPSVRNIVLRGERAINENRRLNSQLEAEKKFSADQLLEKNAQIAARQASYDKVNESYMRTCNELSAIQGKLNGLRAELRELNRKNLVLQKDRYNLERTLGQERREVARLQKGKEVLTKQNIDAAQLNQDMAEQSLKAARENYELTQNNKALRERNDRMAKTNVDLQAEGRRLETGQKELLQVYDKQLRNNEQIEERARELEQKIASLTRKQDELYNQLAGAETTFVQNYNALRQGRLSMRMGEILGRRALDSHLRPEAVKRELLSLLEDASANVQARGGTRGENGRAVRLLEERSPALASLTMSDERQALDTVAQKLSGSNTPLVVTALAVANSVAGEQAFVEFRVQETRPTFRKGEIIATQRIDATRPLERIVQDLVQFLQKDVRDAAVEAGTIPQFDPTTGASEVGLFGPSELVSLTDRVRKLGGRVQVSALAAESLTSADPLRLTFQLTRVPDRK